MTMLVSQNETDREAVYGRGVTENLHTSKTSRALRRQLHKHLAHDVI